MKQPTCHPQHDGHSINRSNIYQIAQPQRHASHVGQKSQAYAAVQESTRGHSQDMATANELATKTANESAETHTKDAAHAQKTIVGLQGVADRLKEALAAQQVLISI